MAKTCFDNCGEMISVLSADSGGDIQWIPSCSSTNAVVEEWASLDGEGVC